MSLSKEQIKQMVDKVNEYGKQVSYESAINLNPSDNPQYLVSVTQKLLSKLTEADMIDAEDVIDPIYLELCKLLPSNGQSSSIHHSPTQPPSRDSNSDSSLTDQPGLPLTFSPPATSVTQQSKSQKIEQFKQESKQEFIDLVNEQLSDETKVKDELRKQGLPTKLSIHNFNREDALKFIEIAKSNVEGKSFKVKKELQKKSKESKLAIFNNFVGVIDKIFPETAHNPIKKPTVEKQACCSVM